LAPILPFAAEEAWSWWHDGSVHATSWPTATAAGSTGLEPVPDLGAVYEVLGRVRRAKTEAKVSQRAAVQRVSVTAPASAAAALEIGRDDLREAGSISELVVATGDQVDHVGCTIELAPST
jgi:valyl-tRNA synthetase